MSGRLPAVVAVSGPKNSGKTTLMEAIVARLAAHGVRFIALKHDAHAHMAMDRPGKDTWRYREAGARHVAITGPLGTVLLDYEAAFTPVTSFDALLENFVGFDLVLAEGFKDYAVPRIVLVAERGDLARQMTLSRSPICDTGSETHFEGTVPLKTDTAVEFILQQIELNNSGYGFRQHS